MEFKDLLNISPLDVVEAIKAKKDLKTSQPNIGFLDEMMERLKAENYDAILVFSIASYLSGTYSAFRLAADTHGLTNVHLVDSRSAAAPIRHVAIKAREMADRGESVETILAFADKVFKDSVTYILPENIEQLVRGGRVKGAVAALINLLKVKLGLLINYNSSTIEKFDTARTEVKLFANVIDTMIKHGANLNYSNDVGESAATWAAALGHFDILAQLLDLGYSHDLQGLAAGVQGRKVDSAEQPEKDRVIQMLRARGVQYPVPRKLPHVLPVSGRT